MQKLLIGLLIAALTISTQAAQKKKPAAKPAPAAPGKNAAKKRPEVIFGTVTKVQENGQDAFLLEVTPSEKLKLPVEQAKKMYINLESFVGKRVAVSSNQDPGSKSIKSILWVKTEEEYKKETSGK